jgi:hypothetical protein
MHKIRGNTNIPDVKKIGLKNRIYIRLSGVFVVTISGVAAMT